MNSIGTMLSHEDSSHSLNWWSPPCKELIKTKGIEETRFAIQV
jgi:hypothetical protein